MKSIKEEALIVIPYVNVNQGCELSLALRGWNKYYKSPFRLIVIGDYTPIIDEFGVEYIYFKRTDPIKGQYRPNIDIARKVDLIYEMFHEEYDHFVLANDDEYPIHDFDWEYLTKLWWLDDDFTGDKDSPTSWWDHDMYKTRKKLDSMGCPRHINYACHHPYYYDMEKYHYMSMKLDLAHNSYIHSSLYYNLYGNMVDGYIKDVRQGIWQESDYNRAKKAFSNENIKFVVNNVEGWSPELEDLLIEYYNGSFYTSLLNDIPKKDRILFILPNRGGTHIDYVVNNLKETFSEYKIHIVVATYDGDDLFKKGQVYNAIVNETKEKWIVLCDNDIVHLNKIDMLTHYRNHGPFIGFNRITQCNVDNPEIEFGSTRRYYSAGAFLFMSRKDYRKINGFSNLYLGWGYEDMDILRRLKFKFGNIFRLDNTLYHITHPKRRKDGVFERNEILYKTMSTRDIKYDGLKQTTYNIKSWKKDGCVSYVEFDDINVTPDFKYKYLLKKDLSYFDVYKDILTPVLDYKGTLECTSNRAHLLVVSLDQVKYTKKIIKNLEKQDTPFDLTIFDNGSKNKSTLEYLNELKETYKGKGAFNLIFNSGNYPLNYVWNWFYENATNEILGYINNDLKVCNNFVSHSIKTFDYSSEIGMVLHPTNVKKYKRKKQLEVHIRKKPVIQGWDFFILRSVYSPIPNDLFIYGGDNWITQSLYLKGKKQAYCVSSPIIHYRSKTINKNINKIQDILSNDINTFFKKYKKLKIVSRDNQFMKRKYQGEFSLV